MPRSREDGISDGKIVFGQVAASQGPAQALGQGMRQVKSLAAQTEKATGDITQQISSIETDHIAGRPSDEDDRRNDYAAQ